MAMDMDSLSNREQQPKLAIDVGGVISSTTDTDNGISSRNVVESTCKILDQNTPTVECADAVFLLVDQFGPENTFILSKCKNTTQLATMRFLWRGIAGGGSFFERTGLLPQNVLFCTKRSGGSALDLEMEELVRDDGSTTGARVAVGDVGKGAIARKFELTHFIDDREECLLSDMFEGHLVEPHFINSQGRKLADDSSPSIDGMLIHFGVKGRIPERNEVYNFIGGHGVKLKGKQREKAVDDCLAKWIVAAGWAGVLQTFDIQKP